VDGSGMLLFKIKMVIKALLTLLKQAELEELLGLSEY